MRQLRRNAELVPLGARAFDLLLYLIRNRDRVVKREEVMAHVWDGVIVGDNNLNVQVSILRKTLGFQAIVTLPARGLRFGLEVDERSRETTASALALPDKPSIAVLPLTDLGVEASFRWLPDWIAEDITTELSRFRGLFVVARNSAFSFRDQTAKTREIARQLGVRYVIEGSVRTGGKRIRVTIQLIDAVSGEQVFAENFDSVLDHNLDLQTEISRTIVAALPPQIDGAENLRVRSVHIGDLNTYGIAQQGWAEVSTRNMNYDPSPRERAIEFAERALALDSNCGLAWRTIAWAHWSHAYHGTTQCRTTTVKAGLEAANHAIAIDGSDHHALRIKALLSFMNQEQDVGLAGLRQAHEINRNCAITLGWLGIYEATHGDVDKGVPCSESALRLSPRDPSRGSLLASLGFAQFASGDYRGAALSADAARMAEPGSATPLVLGAISWVAAGNVGKASGLYRQLNEIAPNLAEARLSGIWLATNQDYVSRARTFLQVAAGLIDQCEAQTLIALPRR